MPRLKKMPLNGMRLPANSTSEQGKYLWDMPLKPSAPKYQDVFGKTIVELAEKNRKNYRHHTSDAYRLLVKSDDAENAGTHV